MEEQYLSVAIPRPLEGLFTYRLPKDLEVSVGGWVKVPFGRGSTHAFVVEPPRPDLPESLKGVKLKDVKGVGSGVCPPEVLDLARFAARYYRAPLGEVLHCAIPAAALGLRSQRQEAKELKLELGEASNEEVSLSAEQGAALEVLRESEKPVLLHGVTGSGKTLVYIHRGREVLAQGKSVLVLVPEIALTPQLHKRIEEGLGVPVALWHSAVPNAKRRDQWAALCRGEIRAVVGARSAIFAPLRDLGLIVVDEEHDGSYKQDDRVRYHARDLAVVRAKQAGAQVVLGSATPSLETLERVREGRYDCARLTERPLGGQLPEIQVVNLGEDPPLAGLQSPLSSTTIEAIRSTLEAGNQAMVFLNRRGFAAFVLCPDCGWVRECPDCSVSLTYHKRQHRLRCHACGYEEDMVESCESCFEENLQTMGAGTESLEEELPRLIPQAKIIRLDRDQITSTSRLEKALDSFRSGEGNILLGTQMLVKGHDFPKVTLVVVVLADGLFRWPEFRAAERAAQVLTQVSGRAGRGETPGRVILQTFAPEHPVVEVVAGNKSMESFLEEERELREGLGYPPFIRLARVRCESKKREEAIERIKVLAKGLSEEEGLILLGPCEAFLERLKGIYRWDLLLKAPRVEVLQRALARVQSHAQQHKWAVSVDVDPN